MAARAWNTEKHDGHTYYVHDGVLHERGDYGYHRLVVGPTADGRWQARCSKVAPAIEIAEDKRIPLTVFVALHGSYITSGELNRAKRDALGWFRGV